MSGAAATNYFAPPSRTTGSVSWWTCGRCGSAAAARSTAARSPARRRPRGRRSRGRGAGALARTPRRGAAAARPSRSPTSTKPCSGFRTVRWSERARGSPRLTRHAWTPTWTPASTGTPTTTRANATTAFEGAGGGLFFAAVPPARVCRFTSRRRACRFTSPAMPSRRAVTRRSRARSPTRRASPASTKRLKSPTSSSPRCESALATDGSGTSWRVRAGSSPPTPRLSSSWSYPRETGSRSGRRMSTSPRTRRWTGYGNWGTPTSRTAGRFARSGGGTSRNTWTPAGAPSTAWTAGR